MRDPAPRVASLLPAATEIVCGLGLRPSLVGVSHECDFPPGLEGLPVLTRSRTRKPGASASPGRSRSIDREIRELLREGLAIYEVDIDALARAAPDVILTQDLCEVCAVPFSAVEAAARALAGADVRIVSLHPSRLGDILADLRRVGAALGRQSEADAYVLRLEARIEDVRRRAAGGPRPSVLTIEWLDPVMIGGLWMPELVEIAGGRCLAVQAGERAPTLLEEQLAALAPDVVLLKPCGFSLEDTRREVGAFLERVRGFGWPALRSGAVWIADGHAYFNRPGPRIVDSLEILAACANPSEFADLAARHARGFEAAFAAGAPRS
jgi:iron complex transport system substrate-binding protein